MKLTINCKDADLAVRFNVSRMTVSNIVNTLISALYELLFKSVLDGLQPIRLASSHCSGAYSDAAVPAVSLSRQ